MTWPDMQSLKSGTYSSDIKQSSTTMKWDYKFACSYLVKTSTPPGFTGWIPDMVTALKCTESSIFTSHAPNTRSLQHYMLLVSRAGEMLQSSTCKQVYKKGDIKIYTTNEG